MTEKIPIRLSRRQLLVGAAGTAVAAAAAVYELVDHEVIPGKHLLDELDGACSVPPLQETFGAPGPSLTGSFYSPARSREVGYTIAYPPGHGRGDRLPLVLVLHGLGGNHASGLGDSISLARALAGRPKGGGPLRPLALAQADGGTGYWHAHPGDNPTAMLVDELLPMCRRLGLGHGPDAVGALGISMGGYGALLLAERHPRLISAVAAISPAIFPDYQAAINADPDSFSSPADFAANNVVTGARALVGKPVRVASGASDPFHPGALALEHALPPGRDAVYSLPGGCHDGRFFANQQLPSLEFLSVHLRQTA